MELRKNLELVDVTYENNHKKAVMTFLDKERKQVRIVNFNKQAYQNNAYVDSDEKAGKVEEWCDQFFGCKFDDLENCVGTKMDVYCYDKFNSLFEIDQIEKFTKDMVGQIFQTEVKEVTVDDYFIRIRYVIDGKTYESKMGYAMYVKGTKEWFQDPQKKEAQFAKFEEKYLVPVERANELIGHPLMVEVKSAFGNNYYGDIKAFPRKK